GAAQKLRDELENLSFGGLEVRVKIDDREKESPGFKYNYWEMRGACVRVELGPRDLEAGTCIVSRRDTGDKQTLSLDAGTASVLVDLLDQIQKDMFAKALAFREENTKRVDTWEEFAKAFEGEGGGGFIVAHWDGTVETEEAIADKTKATIRCIPLE